MNPSSAPCPNQYFFPYPPQNPILNTYPPQNPILNTSPNFFFPTVQQPPPPPRSPPSQFRVHEQQLSPATIAPILDLSTALSSFSDLPSLSLHQTLSTLSSLFSPQTTSAEPQNANFVACPYNPHHLMPPESLFLHSLRCPSPLFDDPSSLIGSLHYPKTTNLPFSPKNLFSHSIQDSNAELCLSLDGFYNEFSSNFFYKDCPGVVNSNDLDNSDKTFTLPAVLSLECANFAGGCDGDNKGFDKNRFKLLPSELWAIRREVEGWVDYPSMYSYGVFCVILQLNVIRGADLRRWIIADSPRYGVVIDVHVRDHISVLFALCLKAIMREALSCLDNEANKRTLSFSCPVLCQVLMWTASQLSCLYGELNAKCFAIHIFRKCVLEAANDVLFPWESNLKERSTDLDANVSDVSDLKLNERVDCEFGTKSNECVDEAVIFVSQVAASVAALHERSLLEAKLKRLRMSQPLPRYHRVADHEYMSKRADEERAKRPNYRAIIDHDGLPSKQSSNQDMDKTKTREELLAEERDYKRRRMSYRGKKLKRTTLQVMRDIIDEYMDEIKEAGGIGCFEKEAKVEGMSSKPSFASNNTMDVAGLREDNSASSETIRAPPDYYYEHSQPNDRSRSGKVRGTSSQYYERHEYSHNRHREHVEYQRNSTQERHGRDYYSASPERHRSHGRLYEQSSCQQEQDHSELTNSKHHDRRSKSNYRTHKSSHSSCSTINSYNRNADDKLDTGDRHQRNSDEHPNSNIVRKYAFEDRYNPAEYDDTSEDDVYTVSKHVRP